ncbi:ParB/RepB/Spo0J family partition protein [Agrobacterium rosae]|uniref:Putative chromosome-partitioning protein ParB n=1 Tax=Agrobacterium rosae TaxID=1972867 RepID=A0A1R3U2X4_9HYPH|nr:ParB/RepB/Spo0J family partition protein [Agrobacterium rosae]SCX35788.1 putative chromosome-partitioning protein ParB [Agrobacterium rosae]
MSKQPTNTAATKPRASFAASSFGNLRAASGEGQGEALRILLVDIDEDPDQPRKSFDPVELESLAESIKFKGVVQPIVVRPPVNGRYMLAFGARRYRASKLAGVADIPAIVRGVSDDDYAAQVIENQQRANLSNGELAMAVEQLSRDGHNNKQIGVICNLKDYQVAAFKQVGKFPDELRDRLDTADIRALYDLFRQWGKTPAEIIDALPDPETYITITEARRIIGSITGKPTGSIVLDGPTQATDPAPSPVSPPVEDREETSTPVQQAVESLHGASPAPTAPRQPIDAEWEARRKASETALPSSNGIPVFIVKVGDGETGHLVVDRRGERPGSALVAYATGIEEVDAAELRIVGIE